MFSFWVFFYLGIRMLLKQGDHKISSFFPTFLVTYLKLSYHNLIIVISTRPNAKKRVGGGKIQNALRKVPIVANV